MTATTQIADAIGNKELLKFKKPAHSDTEIDEWVGAAPPVPN